MLVSGRQLSRTHPGSRSEEVFLEDKSRSRYAQSNLRGVEDQKIFMNQYKIQCNDDLILKTVNNNSKKNYYNNYRYNGMKARTRFASPQSAVAPEDL